MAAVELTVVIPIKNESASLVELHREFTEILARLQAVDPRLRVIRFRRNFGQTAAFAAGFAHARGRLIVTSDGDLQNDPHDIPAMVAWIDGGFDIVCGWRRKRQDTLSRRLPSMMANRLISAVTRVP